MHELTAYDQWVEEGEARGEARGRLRQTQRLILKLGIERLGGADAETELALNSIQDLDRLERIWDAVLRAASWQELLATP